MFSRFHLYVNFFFKGRQEQEQNVLTRESFNNESTAFVYVLPLARIQNYQQEPLQRTKTKTK